MTEKQKPPQPSRAGPPAKPAAVTGGKGKNGKKQKKEKPGRDPFAWFLAGLALSGAIVFALLLWNATSEPRYVLSPRLDALSQEFSFYLLAVALIAFAVACACLLPGRWAWIVAGGVALAGAAVAVAGTLILGIGGGLTCGERQFETASPDRRLLVVAMRGNCAAAASFTYTVVVRELGPSFARQSTIFKSIDSPVPAEASFSTDRTLTLLTAKSNDKPPERYTVTIDRKSLRPSRIWRFRRGTPSGGK